MLIPEELLQLLVKLIEHLIIQSAANPGGAWNKVTWTSQIPAHDEPTFPIEQGKLPLRAVDCPPIAFNGRSGGSRKPGAAALNAPTSTEGTWLVLHGHNHEWLVHPSRPARRQ